MSLLPLYFSTIIDFIIFRKQPFSCYNQPLIVSIKLDILDIFTGKAL